ncbi:MAG TPA: IS1 family transposase, partial [Saprospiraceae bacterium]|nr:IS1 family transposase [Saprospiraceae bacterium]
MIRNACPRCEESDYKKNGKAHHGKQNYRCRRCGRAFIRELDRGQVSPEQQELVKKLSLERISLRGICRVVGVSLGWLLNYLVGLYERLPDHLNVRIEHTDKHVLIQRLEVEADELLSFIKHKKNKQWLWLAMDLKTRQVVAFHVGDRSKHSARKLWKAIPKVYKERAVFYTDQYAGYPGIIPAGQHRAISKELRKTNHIERLNGTLRQRISRLVRATLSFSKKLTNHIGAIHYFICHYNLTQATKFAGQNAGN